MGTRSLTALCNKDGTEIAVLYRQFDGYLSGHGKELATHLAGRKMVNGYHFGEEHIEINGASSGAAMVVSHFADSVRTGEFYLHPPGTRDCGEGYIYVVRFGDGEEDTGIQIAVYDAYMSRDVPVFVGTPQELLDNIDTIEEKLNDEDD